MLAPETQLEPTALRKISRFVAFPSLHNFMGTVICKICRNIKITDIGVHIVPFQIVTHIPRLLCQAFLLSSPALVCVPMMMMMMMISKQALFTERSTECLHGLLSTVKRRCYAHFSLLLGLYNFDFFCRRGKGNEKLSYFASFLSVF